jgi:hypothetical protein
MNNSLDVNINQRYILGTIDEPKKRLPLIFGYVREPLLHSKTLESGWVAGWVKVSIFHFKCIFFIVMTVSVIFIAFYIQK